MTAPACQPGRRHVCAMLACLAMSAAALTGPSCSEVDQGLCLTPSRVSSTLQTANVSRCCAACLADPKCVAWNVNFNRSVCFLRPEHIAAPGHDDACVSSLLRPSPSPFPPSPPTPSDQRPRYHFAPREDATNDVQGPFYDPRHGLYHMGFAWHVNGTHGIGSAPNRWWHQVSRDLAHWQIVSSTPSLAMLSPDTPYDDLAVMTGSVTIVNGTPTALYSCRGSGNKAKGWPSATVALAQPADESDSLLMRWSKSANNPVLNPGFKPSGMPASNGFRDPSVAFRSAGRWRVLTACQSCNGSKSMLGLFSADDLTGPWEYTSAAMPAPQLECPDIWDAIPLVDPGQHGDDIATPTLKVIKLSTSGKEVAFVGIWDDVTQSLSSLRTPVVKSWPKDPTGQLLDATTYASKSFYDPVHGKQGQQVWTSWVHEGFLDSTHGCINRTVCSTHTLPRSLLYDEQLRAHVTPPVPQTSLLRKDELYRLERPIDLTPNEVWPLPATVAANGMQLEILATFALPPSPGLRGDPQSVSAGLSVRRSLDLTQRTETYIAVPSAAQQAEYIEAGDRAAGFSALVLQTKAHNPNGLRPGSDKPTTTAPLPFAIKPGEANVTLRVYVDHSIVESYAQGGRACATARTYPTDDALAAGVFFNTSTDSSSSLHSLKLLDLVVYSMDTIWVDQV